MTRLEELTALKKAVEAGIFPADMCARDLATPGIECIDQVYEPFAGSLDAAKALHEAVLPGYCPSVGQNVWHKYWMATLTITNGDDIGNTYGATHDTCPARAWLIAILSALIAQEEANARA